MDEKGLRFAPWRRCDWRASPRRSVTGLDAVHAVDDVSLDVADHEFMVLLGPSGCGKSTLLRMVAGLEDPTAGDIIIGDRRVNDVAPKARDVAMVFQSYALYPHKTRAGEHRVPAQGPRRQPASAPRRPRRPQRRSG